MFDPTRHGFGFRNPVGREEKRISSLVYGRGLCFGMAVGALGGYLRDVEMVSFPESPELLSQLRLLHLSQFRPVAVGRVIADWSKGEAVSPDLINLPQDPDPHILCFGPSRSRRFFANLGGSHAVVPYRKENHPNGTRVYVYDPNHPKRRDGYVEFGRNGGFVYGRFSSAGEWGVFLLPLSAVSPSLWRVPPGARPR